MTRVRFRRRLVAAVLVIAGCTGSNGDSTVSPSTPGSARTVHIVSQNILHGIACPSGSDRCDLPERVSLFVQQLEDGNCPDLVGLQEANPEVEAELRAELPSVCDGRYEIVSDGDPGLDRELVLTRRPVLGSRRIRLAGPLRTALWVRVAADVGVVDLVTTHLASSSDDRPCDDRTCPTPCDASGTVNACQAVQVVGFARAVAGDDSVVVLGGDLNAVAGEPAIAAILDEGFVDTHLAAGNPECEPKTGEQCTSGRIDDALTHLTDPASRQTERIDYLFVSDGRACEAVSPTGLFNGAAADPPGKGGLVFPSDHTAVQATLSCRTTADHRASARSAGVPASPTTAAERGTPVDGPTLASISDAFHLLFDGDVTDVEAKLGALEDGEILREYFLDSYAAQRAIASRIRVRIDAATVVDADHADVTYSLLLDGAPVLDHLSGAAIRAGDRWLVTRRTYCDVSTQGQPEVPPPCR